MAEAWFALSATDQAEALEAGFHVTRTRAKLKLGTRR